MPEVMVEVMPYGRGWVAYCTEHGGAITWWGDRVLAAFDAIGHATAHHGPPAIPSQVTAPPT